MKKKLDVRLVVSKRMDEEGDEDGVLRVTKRFRENYPYIGRSVQIRTTDSSVKLSTKKAWASEALEQLKKFKAGRITKDQLERTSFVSSRTFKNLVKNNRKKSFDECYISTDIDSLMIGADPEFGLVDPKTGKLMYASQTGAIPRNGELGYDGPLAEIRPDPHGTIPGIVTNIREIFSRGSHKIRNYSWVSGATYRHENNNDKRVYHLGGHIHIGDPIELPSNLRQTAYAPIIQVLDELIAMPMVKIDTPEPHVRRNEMWGAYGMYGRWGDQRPQIGRFEWRVLSGLWLSHPDMAKAVLGATKAVSESCYQAMAEKNFNKEWIKDTEKGFLKAWNLTDAEKVAKIVNEATPDNVSKSMISGSIKKLKDLPNYSKYKDEINEFECLVTMSDKDRGNINLDLRNTWVDGGNLIKEK